MVGVRVSGRGQGEWQGSGQGLRSPWHHADFLVLLALVLVECARHALEREGVDPDDLARVRARVRARARARARARVWVRVRVIGLGSGLGPGLGLGRWCR